MRRSILVLSLAFMHLFCNAQFEKERSVWYFGVNAGIDFRTDPPGVLSNGQLMTIEGCAVANDAQGDLLFYTDGVNIWNKNHQVMKNGNDLYGHQSSTQAALIVKKPGSNELYYVFTSHENNGNTKGLNYSIVDISKNGNLGEVVLKNQNIMPLSSEKLGACLHQNGTDVWIVCQAIDSQITYRAYLLSSAGINPAVFVTSYSKRKSELKGAEAGVLKFSFDNRKAAIAHTYLMGTEVYDFDNSSGQLSNGFVLDTRESSFRREYGVQFSPNSRFLYIATQHRIYQYDLNAADSSKIQNSGKLVYVHPDDYVWLGDMQVATDGRIYIALYGDNYLAAIPNPDRVHPECGIWPKAIDLGTNESSAGLPNFVIVKSKRLFITWENICAKDSSRFSFTPEPADSVKWYFEDPFSSDNFSTALKPYHRYTNSGSYKVTFIRYLNQIADTVTDTVRIYAPVKFVLSKDTTLCRGESIQVISNPTAASFSWDSGEIGNPAYIPQTSGTYYVRAYNGCFMLDSMHVDVDTVSLDFELGNDTVVCKSFGVLLKPGVKGGKYLWHDGSTDTMFQLNGTGTYYVTISSKYCPQKSDTMRVWDCHCDFSIPNVFTPNNDKFNDTFKADICNEAKAFRLLIYNRWGQVVFESDDMHKGWDGRNKDIALPEGTYFWTVRFNSFGEDKKHMGTVTLLR